jgi:hypothetical protein
VDASLTQKQATNWVSTVLKLWLLDTGNVAVPRQTRINDLTHPKAPGLTFTIQGETNLTKGWIAVHDGSQRWHAALIKDTYTGKAAMSGTFNSARRAA